MNNPSADGSEQSFEFDELVARYEKKIFNVIYRIIGDYEEAADLTQDTFISAYKGLSRFRGDSKVYTWIYQIALNHCRNKLRQRSRARKVPLESLDQPKGWDDEDSGQQREIADTTYAPHVILEDKELHEKIMEAMQALSPEYREVVVLREIQNLSYNEIAEVTGLSLDNVKTRLSRARGMLRRRLEPYYRQD